MRPKRLSVVDAPPGPDLPLRRIRKSQTPQGGVMKLGNTSSGVNPDSRSCSRFSSRIRQQLLVIAIGISLVLFSPVLLAQSGAGSIEGTVTDATKAVIPGASIE